jgi:diadenosine tetraphosphate (Ap4A) HIT family hydrolase
MDSRPCPFCTLPSERIVDQNDLALVIRDGFPVSPGHTLVIPKRHVGSFFELDQDEVQSMLALLKAAKVVIDEEFKPDSYNIGINDGPQAGQTVPHVHMHLIPRYQGDVKDPRGGVRWLIPTKADYWTDRED